MSELDLDAIRERAGYRSAAGFASPDGRAADIDSADDVPALLAEVERLRGEIGSVEALADMWSGMGKPSGYHQLFVDAATQIRAALTDATP